MLSESKKHFEIERKFRLSEEEYGQLPARLSEAYFTPGRTVIEKDTFFPVEKQGDMLRLRDEQSSDLTRHIFTRKTWVETAGAKERSESEEEVSPFLREFILAVVRQVHPEPLRTLKKKRSFFEKSQSAGAQVVVTLDYVDGLGIRSGPYMEIELIIEHEQDVQSARDKIQELALRLLHEQRDDERMSYQDMLAEVWR